MVVSAGEDSPERTVKRRFVTITVFTDLASTLELDILCVVVLLVTSGAGASRRCAKDSV